MAGGGGRQWRGEPLPMPPHPGGPPCLVYLVVAWDPWNWAAVAVSQELLPEAERDVRPEVSGCPPELGTEGNAPACPGSPPDPLGPLTASPRPLLLPAGWGAPRQQQSAPTGVTENCSMGRSAWGLHLWERNHGPALPSWQVCIPARAQSHSGRATSHTPSEAALLPPSLLSPKLQLMQFRPNPDRKSVV